MIRKERIRKQPGALEVGDTVRLVSGQGRLGKPEKTAPDIAKIVALNHRAEGVVRLDRTLGGLFYWHIDHLEKA